MHQDIVAWCFLGLYSRLMLLVSFCEDHIFSSAVKPDSLQSKCPSQWMRSTKQCWHTHQPTEWWAREKCSNIRLSSGLL